MTRTFLLDPVFVEAMAQMELDHQCEPEPEPTEAERRASCLLGQVGDDNERQSLRGVFEDAAELHGPERALGFLRAVLNDKRH